ncbi:MAG: MerR family transcriptional regulator [Streptosporangiales bacterium]|nr:MerR family transcriptional regulator [Streptosporangiales bacterium]
MKSNDDGELMTIGVLADRFGMATHVLRHWEAMGLLTPATRVSGQRRYTRDQMARVVMIVRSKAAGLSLEQIRGMLTGPTAADRKALLADHYAKLDRRIAEIQAAKKMVEHALHCSTDDFTRCPDFQRVVQATIGQTTPKVAAGKR